MLEFATRAERGHRSYRDAIAEAQGQLDSSGVCTACGSREPSRITPRAATVITDVTQPPPGLPTRDLPARQQRLAALQRTGGRLAAEVRRAVPDTTFAIWIAPLILVDATDCEMYLAAPAHLASWAADRYEPLLGKVASELAGRHLLAHIYVADEDLPDARTLGELTTEEEGPRRVDYR
jgi:hypothetical protein